MIRALLLCLILPLSAMAQTVPDALSAEVNDYADLLSPEAEARVAAALAEARAETGVHIVVATITARADYGADGMRIEDFAKTWFNAWGIGDPARNDGILILVAARDREMRIALGSGYDPVYDGRAQRVIDTAFLPEFREGRFEAGIEAGVASAVDRLARPFAAREAVTEEDGFAPDGGDGSWGGLGLFLTAAAGLFGWARRDWLADRLAILRRCPNCGARGLRRSRDVLRAATRGTSGEGILHTRCPSCGDDRTRRYTIPRVRSTSGRSGGGGFGGGRSSGGGATGRW